jgi:hypothetical protein
MPIVADELTAVNGTKDPLREKLNGWSEQPEFLVLTEAGQRGCSRKLRTGIVVERGARARYPGALVGLRCEFCKWQDLGCS